MNTNEMYMKERGERRVWSSIETKNGGLKKIASTQLGQQVIIEESLRVLPDVLDWINNSSGRSYRTALKNYFEDEEFLLAKIAETYLFLAGSIYRDLDSDRSSDKKVSRHKRVNTLQKRITPDLSFELSWRFLEVVIELSQYFGIEKLLHYKEGTYNWSFKYTCLLNDEIMSKLSIEAAEAFYPMPMFEPPLDWTYEDGEIRGGYRDYQYEMIRSSRDIDYTKYSQRIFDAINYIQSIPWRVNEDLLNQVSSDLKMPERADYIKSSYPDPEPCRWDIDLKAEEEIGISEEEVKKIQAIRKSFREQVELYNAEAGDYESALGKYRAVKMAIQIAKRYVGRVIYFPHSFDSRGRVYPITVGLSPQGSDAIKALIEYDRGEVLTTRGEEWCWSYLASLWGEDKIPFEDRVKMGKELLEADYREADEPYQFLAHQIEMKKYLEDPTREVKLRIHLDACNSGSQFTSAITGDRAGCIATNVIPTINEDGSHTRQDAYILVSDKALKTCKDSSDETYKFFQGLLEEQGRKICKTPVMVSNYGGTAGGRAEILWNMLRELGVERKWITRRVSSQFSNVIGDAIAGVLNGGKAFETYIHEMNNAICRRGQPIWWTTSDGFHIVHVKNKELKSKQVTCMLPGARRKTTIIKKQYSDRISPVKMKSAIAPNYIHSLDAELLRRVALKMKRAGIKDSDWIHDSFGCHPNHVDLMLEITKIEFKKLVRRAPLRTLDKELRSQADSSKLTAKMLKNIKIPSLRGFDASKGDLDVVMESNWFFS